MLCLLLAASSLGCGGSSASSEQQVTVVKENAVSEFEWGIERLDRALRVFKPSSGEGVHVTERKLDYEIFPPSEENTSYTARVTISTEAAFLHARRRTSKEEQVRAEESKKTEAEDLLAEQPDVIEFVDIPGAGPKAPSTAAAQIEPRSVESETIFELVYRDGSWELTNELDLDYEKEWFKYAFE